MAGSHTSLHYHIVFSTKNRVCMIRPEWFDHLHEYLGGIVRGHGGKALNVGGMADHVHLLIGLPATRALSDVVREIKSESSGWLHREIGAKRFGWQDGYGGFTVGPPQLSVVGRYIDQQPKHHLRRTFQEEYLDLLRRSGIDFDERFLW